MKTEERGGGAEAETETETGRRVIERDGDDERHRQR